MASPYETYKVNDLINQYRANPDMFNDDQLDELERIAEQNQINFKRKESPFSLGRAMQQASAGFIEGFTTLDLIPKEPRNTGEAIFRQLGHLAGFAPSILKAPVVGLAKVVAMSTGRKTKDVLKHKVTSSVMNAIDFVGPKSIPMIAQKKTVSLFNKGLSRSGADALDYMKRGAKTRAIAEEAVGLAGASAVSSIWKGGDAIIDSFIGGAIAGGAFGGIGNFANVARFHKGNAEQIEKANKILRTGLGSLTTGLPATLRDDPVEMQIYEYLLGGFFGYNTRPIKERVAHEWLVDPNRPISEVLDPSRSKDFKNISKEAQDYILFEHPMPRDSNQWSNSKGLGGTTGQALSWLEKYYPLNHTAEARASLGKNATDKNIKLWYGQKAGSLYATSIRNAFSKKPPAEAKKTSEVMDFNDPYESNNIKTNGLVKSIYPKAKGLFKTEKEFGEKLVKIRQRNDNKGVEDFMADLQNSIEGKLNKKQLSNLRLWYGQQSQPIQSTGSFTIEKNRNSTIATYDYSKNKMLDEYVSSGEKYHDFPINKLTDGGFGLLSHIVENGVAKKILNSYPDYNKKKIIFNVDDPSVEMAMHRELYNNNLYIFSGIKDKNALMTAPLKTEIAGSKVTPKELIDVMQNGLRGIPADAVRKKLVEGYEIAKSSSNLPENIFNDIWVSNILHHAQMNGMLKNTGNKITDLSGIVRMMQGEYSTSASDFNKRMQLLGNRMVSLDPKSFTGISPDGNLNVIFIKDSDMLRAMGFKPDKNEKYAEASMTDGGIIYRQAVTKRVLDSLGLPDAGHFKPVSIGKGQAGLFATKSNGQLASPVWEAFMRANNIDAVVMGSAFKLRGDYRDTPMEYNKNTNQYSSKELRPYKIPIQDMQVSLGTYENMSKAVKGELAPLQLYNTYDFEHKGFAQEYFKMAEKTHEGSKNGKAIVEGSTNKDGKIDILKFKNQMEVSNARIQELPLDFVIKHLLDAKGNKEVGAYLFNEIQKLDAKGEFAIDTFKRGDADFTQYNELMERISYAGRGNYNTRFLLFKDHNTSFLKRFIISRYANPFIETGGKAWLKAITPDMLKTMDAGPNNKRKIIKEGHVYLDNAFKEMPVVLGDKRYNLKQIWDFHTGAEPIPKGITKKSVYDALELVAIRIPSDSPSGSRVLRFGGFTNQKGAGAFTHHKDDFYLGGADKDSDTIKIFQGFSKKLKDVIKGQANEKESYRDVNSKEYNPEYAKAINRPFESDSLSPTEKFQISGRGKGKEPLDVLIPKMLMFSPQHRLDVAKRAKAGKDGLSNGLSASVYLKNILDFINIKGVDKTTGEVSSYKTPWGTLEIDVKTDSVAGKSRMQYFRDLVSNIVNKSADASSDPTIKNYSHFRDMLFNTIFDAKLDGKPIKTYKKFSSLVESSDVLKPIVRSVHNLKINNSFRFIDKDVLGALKKDKQGIYLKGRTWFVTPDAFEKLNLHIGERIVIDRNEPFGLLYFNGKKPKTKDKRHIKLRAELIPTKPEFIDLEIDLSEYGLKTLNDNYIGASVKKMFEQIGNLDQSYSNRFGNAYGKLFEYIGSDIYAKLEGMPKSLRSKIEKNLNILLEHIDLPPSNIVKTNLKTDRNLGLDQVGKVMGQFATIESLNRQFVDLNKYLIKKESKIKVDELTDWAYKKNREVKEISGGGLKAQEATENLMNKHMKQIEERALAYGLDPAPFVKYYHTMLLSPILGKSKSKEWFNPNKKKVQKQNFPELRHDSSIHGSTLIPQQTRREYYQGLERFVNKLEKDYNESTSKFKLEDAFDESKIGLKAKEKEAVVEQLNLPFKEPSYDTPKGDVYDRLALNGKDLAEVKKFTENIEKNPILKENIDEWFGSFTTMYGDMVPRNLKDMNIKDVYAINRFFKKMGDPTDLSFHMKNFLHDPRYVDQLLVSKGIARKVSEMMVKNPLTGELVNVAKILSPAGSISEYSKNVKDKGIDIDTIRLKKKNEKLFKYLQELPDRDATTRELIDWREGNRQGALSTEAQKLNTLVTDFYKNIGDNYVYVKDSKGNRYTDSQGNWALDKDFKTFYKDTKGRLNQYIEFKKDGEFNFEKFFEKVVDINFNDAKFNIPKIRRTVGVDGLKRYLYEMRLFRNMRKAEKESKSFDKEKWILDYRNKNPFKGTGYIDPVEYVSHGGFGKTEASRKEFVESVKAEANRKYNEVLSKTNSVAKAKKVRDAYIRQMEDVANFQAEFMTMKDIADLGEVNEAVLDKSLERLGLKTRIGPLEGREANLQGYDKSHAVFNDYVDKVVNGYYKTMSAIHGDREISLLKENFKNRKIPETEVEYFKKLYERGDKRKSRRKDDTKLDKTIELGGREPRYKNYIDVWADYLKLHLQTVLGHQTYFPEQIMYEVNRNIDPLGLKDKRNLFYLTSDQNMMNLYEKLWQKKKFKKAPFIGKILSDAPMDAQARKEYFSRKIHEFGRMEAQYELMTLLANTGTWATNIFSGNVMTGASAGIRNFINTFNNKKVYDRLLTSNGKPVLKTLDGKFVKNRKQLTKYLEERGVLDNFIQHEFEYNEGMTSNLKKAGVSIKNFKRDLTTAMKNEKGKREESILEVVSRYGVKDTMLKYGSFFMRQSEQFNRVNSYMAHALQAMEKFGAQARELSIADPFIHEFAMKGIENTQFLYQNSFRPMFMRTATGKVLSRFKLFAWNSIRTRREFYKQAKLYGFKEGTLEYKRAKDLFLTDMFMMALGGAFMFSIFDTSLAPPYDWIQALADWMYGDKNERDMAFFGSKLGPANLLKPPIARVPEAMGQILTGDWEQFSGYTAYTLFPFGRLARQVKQLSDDGVGRGLERAPEILVRFPYNKIQSRIERAKRRSEQAEEIEAFLG